MAKSKKKKSDPMDLGAIAGIIAGSQTVAGDSAVNSLFSANNPAMMSALSSFGAGTNSLGAVGAAYRAGGPAIGIAERYQALWSNKVGGELQGIASRLGRQYQSTAGLSLVDAIAAGAITSPASTALSQAISQVSAMGTFGELMAAGQTSAMSSLIQNSGIGLVDWTQTRARGTNLIDALDRLGWETDEIPDEEGLTALADLDVDDEQLQAVEETIEADSERLAAVETIESVFEVYYGLTREQSHHIVRVLVLLSTIGSFFGLLVINPVFGTAVVGAMGMAPDTLKKVNLDTISRGVADKVAPLPEADGQDEDAQA